MTDGDDPATRAGAARRPLWTALLSLLLAAGALWGASSLTWVEVPRGLTVDGRMADDLTGADLVSWPVPLALLALAAVPALPALPGTGRRLLGVLLVLVGAWAAVLALNGGAYDIAWSGWAPGYEGAGESSRTPWGPAAAVVGGVAMLTAGAVAAWRGPAMPRMGAKYSAPTSARRSASAQDGADGTAHDTARDDEADLWNALTEGEDPTARER